GAYTGAGPGAEVPAVGDRQVIAEVVEEGENFSLAARRRVSRVHVMMRVAEFKLGTDTIRETVPDRTFDERGVSGVDLVDLVASGIQQRILRNLDAPQVIPAGSDIEIPPLGIACCCRSGQGEESNSSQSQHSSFHRQPP